MAFTSRKRLFFSCVYLGAMLGLAGTVYYRMQAFEGTVVLRQGSAEHLALRAAESGLVLGLSQRNLPRDLLLLDTPGTARVLRADQNYDAIVLPFGLRLDAVEVLKAFPPSNYLDVEGPEQTGRHLIGPGDRLSIGDDSMEITAIGPWEGLLRVPSGNPMAAVRLSAEGPLLFLESGHWYQPQPDLAVAFFWHPNEAAMRAAFLNQPEDIKTARWGVRDGAAVQWLENFVPGTGLRLRNGDQVQLLEDRRAEGTISVQWQHGNAVDQIDVHANQPDSTSPFTLEMPGASSRVLMLHAWREDQLEARLLAAGQPPREHRLAQGDQFQFVPEGPDVDCQQVMASAAAAPGGAVYAATLLLDGRRYVLREGAVETVRDWRVHYTRDPVPPEARYTISALDPAGAAIQTISLAGRDRVRAGSWLFSLANENPFAPAGIALKAVRRPGGAAQVVGAILFLGGSFGLVLVRFGGRLAPEARGESFE